MNFFQYKDEDTNRRLKRDTIIMGFVQAYLRHLYAKPNVNQLVLDNIDADLIKYLTLNFITFATHVKFLN